MSHQTDQSRKPIGFQPLIQLLDGFGKLPIGVDSHFFGFEKPRILLSQVLLPSSDEMIKPDGIKAFATVYQAGFALTV